MRPYREVLGKVEGMQRGFTSGASVQAAAKGAVEWLLTGEAGTHGEITLKGGVTLAIPLVNPLRTGEGAECGVIKDAGDDSDVTHGHEFRVRAEWADAPGLTIRGGKGVGLVTREGLPVKPGLPAINPGPLRMIRGEIEPLIPPGRGMVLTVTVPDGEALAGETWNPRLGIDGGISIIGTSGIVEPKSASAYRASIALGINVIRKGGCREVYLTPGYVGEGYLTEKVGLPLDRIVKVGDHIGFALDQAAARGFESICLVGHIGKMVKLAAGLFNTHCEYGDARLETMAACAAAAGATREDVRAILDMKMAEAAVPFLRERHLEETFRLINLRLMERIGLRLKRDIRLTSVITDLKGEVLSEERHV